MRDQQILSEIQLAVLEPDDAGALFPSGLWSPTEVLAYLNEQQQAVLRRCQLSIGRAFIDPAVVGSITQTLPGDWVQTVLLSWQASPPGGAWQSVVRSTSREFDRLLPTWASVSGTPIAYADDESTTLTLRVAPRPSVAGRFEIVYLAKGPELDRIGPDGLGEVVGLLSDVAPALKWATLARMLSKVGRALDPARAQYAQMLSDQWIAAGQTLVEGR